MEHSDASTLLVDTEVTVIQFSTAGIWPSCLFLQGLHITNFTGQITLYYLFMQPLSLGHRK